MESQRDLQSTVKDIYGWFRCNLWSCEVDKKEEPKQEEPKKEPEPEKKPEPKPEPMPENKTNATKNDTKPPSKEKALLSDLSNAVLANAFVNKTNGANGTNQTLTQPKLMLQPVTAFNDNFLNQNSSVKGTAKKVQESLVANFPELHKK